MEELWKTITYAPNYQISNLGNVKNIKSNKLIKINYDRLKKTNSRARVGFTNNENKSKGYYLHRIVAQHFIDNPNNLPEVNHKNGDFYDNKASNLEWISKLDNMRHANENNLINRFKRQIKVVNKLTNAEQLFDSVSECAKQFNCSIGSISKICNNKINNYFNDFEITFLDVQLNDNNYKADEEQLENIIWKPYPNLDKYLVSNTGEVKHKRTNRILKGSKVTGYRFVNLNRDDGTKRNCLVHRLVAETFLENPENKPVVNHKDTNILNNNLNNLEWVTYKENMNTNETIANLKKGKNSKNILQIDIETGNIISNFYGASEGEKLLNIDGSTILKVCNYYNRKNVYRNDSIQKTYQRTTIFIFEEDKDKLTEIIKIAKTKDINKNSKPVVQIDKNTNKIINTFESAFDASRKLNISSIGISQCCNYYKYNDNNRPKCYNLKSHKGFIFKQTDNQ